MSYSVLRPVSRLLYYFSNRLLKFIEPAYYIFHMLLNPIKFISNGPCLNILRGQLTLFEKSILECVEGKCGYKWFLEICNILSIVCKYVNIETIKYVTTENTHTTISYSQFWVYMSGFIYIDLYVYFLVFLSVICFGFIFVLVDIIFCQVFPIIFDLFCISKLSK